MIVFIELSGKKDRKYEKVEKASDHPAGTNIVDRQRFYELSF